MMNRKPTEAEMEAARRLWEKLREIRTRYDLVVDDSRLAERQRWERDADRLMEAQNPEVPLVAGGQGRTAEETEETGHGSIVAGVLFVALLAAALWWGW